MVWHRGIRAGPANFLEYSVHLAGKGIEDLGPQGLCNLLDVEEQLGSGALGFVLQADQTGVQRAQLLVRLEGVFIGCVELLLCLVTSVSSADCVLVGGAISIVLPQHMDLLEQLQVGARHVEALQRAQDGLEARDGVVAGLGGRDDEQSAVDVILFLPKASYTRLEARLVVVLRLFRIGEVPLGILELPVRPRSAEGRGDNGS